MDQFIQSTEFLRQLDDFFFELSTHMSVEVMAGETDPASYALPQKAMFRGMFPRSSTLGSFSTASNPLDFIVDDIKYPASLSLCCGGGH